MVAYVSNPLMVRNPREDATGAIEDIVRWARQGPTPTPTIDPSLPRGVVASAFTAAATNSGVSGVNLDVGPTVTWTASPERLYRIEVFVPRMFIDAALTLDARFTNGTNSFLAYAGTQTFTGSGNSPFHAITYVTSINGSYTVKLRASSSNTNAVTFQFGGYASTITVEDVGLA
jgi:hypothetical protein